MNASPFGDKGPPGEQGPVRPEVQTKAPARDNDRGSNEHCSADVHTAVFEASLDALLVAGDDRRYSDANPAACALLGRTRDQLRALRVEDVSPMGTDAVGAWAAFVEQGEATGTYTVVRPDGSTVPVEFAATANITPGYHLVILHDVSERVTADKLAMDRAREKAVLVQLGELALTSRATSVFDAACTLVADTLSVEVVAVGEFATDGQSVLVQAGAGLPGGVAGELRLPMDDGSLAGRVFHSRMPAGLDDSPSPEGPGASLNRALGVVNAVSVLIGGSAEPFGVLAADSTSPRTLSLEETTFLQAVANLLGELVERDRISDERDMAGGELARREQEFRTLAEHSPDIIIRVNRDLRLAYVSPSADRITSQPASSFIGRPVRELGHAAKVGALWERALGQVVTNRDPTTIEFSLHGVGGPSHYEALLTPELATDGTVETVLMISHDITERRAAEALRRRALTQILDAEEAERAKIADDMHDDSIQVMVAVGMRLEALKRHLFDDETRSLFDKLAETVSRSIERLRSLMFELRPPELDRIGLSGTLRLHLETNSAGMPAWEITDDFLSPLAPDTVGALYRIALEALANVRKHAHASLVRVMIDENSGGVRLRVHDDGLGFNQAELLAGGLHHMGMGAMRERAEGAGGRLDVSSGPGEGTTISAWIPRPLPAGVAP